jgi:hypothetical protein
VLNGKPAGALFFVACLLDTISPYEMRSYFQEELMAVDRSFVERNSAERQRLKNLLSQLSDEDLTRSVGGGWTVAATLGHLAFWDQRAFTLLERWERQGVGPSDMDTDLLNRAALPLWLALPPRKAVELALAAAEAVDRKLETVSDEIVEWCFSPQTPIAIFRAEHRGEHIDQIQDALKKNGD